MGKMEKKYVAKNWLLIGMAFLFVVLGIAWCIQVKSMQKQAAGNSRLVYQMLGELEEGVSYEEIAADLLKGNENQEAVKEGLYILMKYGYDEDYKSIFVEQTKEYAWRLAVFYLVCYLLFLAMFCGIRRIVRKNREMELYGLQEILEQFYNGEYGFSAQNFGEETENLIYMRLESLGQKLMLKEERLETEKEETKALVTDLSHQLKTPVASIKMCYQFLEEENLQPEEKKEFMERLGVLISYLDELLAALVNISRMEMGMITIQRENANIFETIVQAVNQVYMKAEEKGIEIAIDSQSPEIEKLTLPHDVKWTKEAVVNVLENAIKYSPVDSHIWITMEKQVHFFRILIKDEGIGIKKEEINRIFKRFYRGKHEMVRKAEGSGVGLYLTRKILEEQGGSIAVVLPPGKEKEGSTFAIMLSLR